MKNGIDLVCKLHGVEGLLIQECSPYDKHAFKITCKCACRHHKWACDRQIEQLLRSYPDCDAREYKASGWDNLFERQD
jgi:hypothetical protein